jgi:hypothetical protein
LSSTICGFRLLPGRSGIEGGWIILFSLQCNYSVMVVSMISTHSTCLDIAL